MLIRILTEDKYPYIKKLKKNFKITRVINIKSKKHLSILELISKKGIFKAYGENVKKALKNSKKVLAKSCK